MSKRVEGGGNCIIRVKKRKRYSSMWYSARKTPMEWEGIVEKKMKNLASKKKRTAGASGMSSGCNRCKTPFSSLMSKLPKRGKLCEDEVLSTRRFSMNLDREKRSDGEAPPLYYGGKAISKEKARSERFTS